MGRTHRESGYEAVTGAGSTRAVRVIRVYRQRGAQVLACYSEESVEGFVFVLAAEVPRIEPGDIGVITFKRVGGGGRWEFERGVG